MNGTPEYVARSQLQRWAYITREQIRVVRAELREPEPVETLDFDNLSIGEFEKAVALRHAPVAFLLMAAWQVVKALKVMKDLPEDVRRLHDPDLYERLKLHRDIWEHWEEHQLAFSLIPSPPARRSARRFKELFPEGTPLSLAYTEDGDWFRLGTPAGGIDVAEIERLLNDLDAATGLGPSAP